jgi:hypothetical protein
LVGAGWTSHHRRRSVADEPRHYRRDRLLLGTAGAFETQAAATISKSVEAGHRLADTSS